ncbi:hypothetical protein SBRCBS47491_004932 [Sporothrix bragantina]|uniref:Conidiation-specific protein 6 n=1 Tax=Sporothrix bragantina TaxID=671064 RepID=A0ABP0BSR3_9PEZI
MDSKSNQASQPHADASKPAETHHSAGSEALRRAYAKYNINPTNANPAGHNVSTDEATQRTGDLAKNIKGTENEPK